MKNTQNVTFTHNFEKLFILCNLKKLIFFSNLLFLSLNELTDVKNRRYFEEISKYLRTGNLWTKQRLKKSEKKYFFK